MSKADEAFRRLVAKVEVLTHYGKNCQLQCCWRGCTVRDSDALTLDHIKDNGNKNRCPGGRRRGGASMYQWIKSHGFPSGYATLCGGHQNCKELRRRRSTKTVPKKRKLKRK